MKLPQKKTMAYKDTTRIPMRSRWRMVGVGSEGRSKGERTVAAAWRNVGVAFSSCDGRQAVGLLD